MKNMRVPAALAPAGAVASALAMLSCCLPWGVGAALGALGLSVFFARFQTWFLILSVMLLFLGFFQLLRKGGSCQRRSKTQIALLSIAAVVVLAIVLFPQWIAGMLVGHLP
jgi:high-affinity Fe2+/Pb2+ permease